jgi:alpha-L-arabinofuranosidase
MGTKLLDCLVSGSSEYETRDWHTLVNFQGKAPYVKAHATLSADGTTLSLMLVNKHPDAEAEIAVEIRGFRPSARGVRRVLNGPGYLAHNDDASIGFHSAKTPPAPVVKIEESAFEGAGPRFPVRLPPHSVTVLELPAR